MTNPCDKRRIFTSRKYYAEQQIASGKYTVDDYDEHWLLKKGKKKRKSTKGYEKKGYKTAEYKKKVGQMCARRCAARKLIASGKYTLDDYDDEWFLKNGRQKKKNPYKATPLWKKLAQKDPTIIAPPPEFA